MPKSKNVIKIMQQICHSSTDVPREQSQLRKHLHTYKYIRKHSADCQIIVCRYSTPEKKTFWKRLEIPKKFTVCQKRLPPHRNKIRKAQKANLAMKN